ncbi:hypothetical protein OG432_30670 [Streptomyces sp. NBC_00442]|uniref:hypothetical protein n=1 Tax=Streptomyces sp. NBC_00442 TaxID=2903651 RepID=UPI002E1EB2C0
MRGASDGLQTGPCAVPRRHRSDATAPAESTIMNLITDLLAGVFHFLGWLV